MGAQEAVNRLADACGILRSYKDQSGARRTVSTDAVLAALQALGEPVRDPEDAAGALAARAARTAARLIDPVLVAWDGAIPEIRLRENPDRRRRPARFSLMFEGGGGIEWTRSGGRRRGSGGAEYPLPIGRHRLSVERGPERGEAIVLSAPTKCFRSEWLARSMGVFLPLYALRTDGSWGTGDLSDLRSLAEFAGEQGCRVVGTLPLLASYLDEPFEPSPYAPVSRLFWNELYLDPLRAPDLAFSGRARRLIESPAHRSEVRALRAMSRVDYRRAAAAKRRVLEGLAAALSGRTDRRREEFDRWVRGHPAAVDYAAFRAAAERQRTVWQHWPARLRDGQLKDGDSDARARWYHLYVQWLLEEQFAAVAGGAAAAGTKLYLDLPIGVHSGGFDVWRHRSAFATEASVGAPPDMFFAAGQDWGFPPPHPERQREDGYEYWAASLRSHMRHAGVLRIDHAAGLHRLYWIPRGRDASGGVYITYPAEEMFAVLSIESHRWRTTLVGENLGTVPPIVNRLMRRHGVLGMYVGQFEVRADRVAPLPSPSRDVLACMNTHDTATFASFYGGRDVRQRVESGLLGRRQAEEERKSRARIRKAVSAALARGRGRLGPAAALAGLLERLARSDCEMLLITLEDLWSEKEPQNVPGTTEGNWRHKARMTLEQVRESRRIAGLLARIRASRSRVGTVP